MVWRPRTGHGRKHGTGGEMVIQGDLTPNRPLRKQLYRILKIREYFMKNVLMMLDVYRAID